MSGNTVWPQASGFQKLSKMEDFWHFWLTFVHSKCKRSSLRSQCWMRLFLWFSNTMCHHKKWMQQKSRQKMVPASAVALIPPRLSYLSQLNQNLISICYERGEGDVDNCCQRYVLIDNALALAFSLLHKIFVLVVEFAFFWNVNCEGELRCYISCFKQIEKCLFDTTWPLTGF